MSEKVIRAYGLSLDETKQGNIVEGYATVFNSPTVIGEMFEERIDPHAFDSCVFDDACLLVNHDTSRMALARCRRNTPNSTLQITTDAKGLFIRATLDIENNTEARNLYSAIKRGDIDGMSFMFTVDGDEWTDLKTDMPKRTITKISRVFEVSAVNFPAYKDTSINARSTSSLESDKKALENALSVALENDKNLELEKRKFLFKIKENRKDGFTKY